MKKNIKNIFSLKIVQKNSKEDTILDVRSTYDQKKNPLILKKTKIKLMPFYKIQSEYHQLSKEKSYLLYCEKGIMSRLQAFFLIEKGFKKIKILKK
ncbi:MAG: hypothetical protein RA161_00150 [Arsenophonus sp.]|nr:MAG: hypothetical protein RA161_00150 [Arsenophonus sp.]